MLEKHESPRYKIPMMFRDLISRKFSPCSGLKSLKSVTHTHTHTFGRQLKIIFLDGSDCSMSTLTVISDRESDKTWISVTRQHWWLLSSFNWNVFFSPLIDRKLWWYKRNYRNLPNKKDIELNVEQKSTFHAFQNLLCLRYPSLRVEV